MANYYSLDEIKKLIKNGITIEKFEKKIKDLGYNYTSKVQLPYKIIYASNTAGGPCGPPPIASGVERQANKIYYITNADGAVSRIEIFAYLARKKIDSLSSFDYCDTGVEKVTVDEFKKVEREEKLSNNNVLKQKIRKNTITHIHKNILQAGHYENGPLVKNKNDSQLLSAGIEKIIITSGSFTKKMYCNVVYEGFFRQLIKKLQLETKVIDGLLVCEIFNPTNKLIGDCLNKLANLESSVSKLIHGEQDRLLNLYS